jgi:hypothetical protein
MENTDDKKITTDNLKKTFPNRICVFLNHNISVQNNTMLWYPNLNTLYKNILSSEGFRVKTKNLSIKNYSINSRYFKKFFGKSSSRYLYILNPADFVCFMLAIKDVYKKNIGNMVIDFLNRINYIVIWQEILLDNLHIIGYNESCIDKDFILRFFSRSKLNIISNLISIETLTKYGITHNKYFTITGYSVINNIVPFAKKQNVNNSKKIVQLDPFGNIHLVQSEPNTELIIESKTESLIEPNCESNTELNIDSKCESIMDFIIDPNFEEKTDSIFRSITDSNIDSNTESDVELITESNTEIIIESDIEPNTELNTDSNTESDIELITESNTESDVEFITELNTESDVEFITELNTDSNTESDVEPNTEPNTEIIIESGTEPNTEIITESDVELITETDVELITESGTEPNTEIITESDVELITETDVELITESNTEPNTEIITESDTDFILDSDAGIITNLNSEINIESGTDFILNSDAEIITESNVHLITELNSDLIAESIIDSITNCITNSITKCIIELKIESITDSIIESITKSITDSITKSKIKSIIDPVTDSNSDSTTKLITEFIQVDSISNNIIESTEMDLIDDNNNHLIEFNNKKPYVKNPDEIDVFIYGTMHESYAYRNTLISELLQLNNDKYNIDVCGDIYGEDLDLKLMNSKIVVHVPSFINLEHMPWPKITYLQARKVFYIIEDNEELHKKNLENFVISYQKENAPDLFAKIEYYIDKDGVREEIIEKNYNYIYNNSNMDIIIPQMIRSVIENVNIYS